MIEWAGLDHWHAMEATSIAKVEAVLDTWEVAVQDGEAHERLRIRPIVESDESWLKVAPRQGRTLAVAAAEQWSQFRPPVKT